MKGFWLSLESRKSKPQVRRSCPVFYYLLQIAYTKGNHGLVELTDYKTVTYKLKQLIKSVLPQSNWYTSFTKDLSNNKRLFLLMVLIGFISKIHPKLYIIICYIALIDVCCPASNSTNP